MAAIKAAQQGAEVTLVEKDKLGGTCLNRGCIPTKALLRSADVAEEARKGGEYGVECGKVSLNWSVIQARRAAVSAQLSGGVAGLMKKNKVRVISGEAVFTGPKTVRVKTAKARKFSARTGSSLRRGPFPPPSPFRP